MCAVVGNRAGRVLRLRVCDEAVGSRLSQQVHGHQGQSALCSQAHLHHRYCQSIFGSYGDGCFSSV